MKIDVGAEKRGVCVPRSQFSGGVNLSATTHDKVHSFNHSGRCVEATREARVLWLSAHSGWGGAARRVPVGDVGKDVGQSQKEISRKVEISGRSERRCAYKYHVYERKKYE